MDQKREVEQGEERGEEHDQSWTWQQKKGGEGRPASRLSDSTERLIISW